jgi:hypothetical protein
MEVMKDGSRVLPFITSITFIAIIAERVINQINELLSI